MKICHVVTSLNVGGAERFVIDISTAQKKKGHDVKIISFGCDNDILNIECERLGIDVININKDNFFTRNTRFYREVKSVDLIHLHSHHAIKATVLALNLINNVKIIYTRHGAKNLEGFMWSIIHNIIKRKVKHVTFVSEDAFNVFQNNYNWNGVAYHVIENGVSLPDTPFRKPKSEKLRLGSVGRMVPLKHQSNLITAVSKLPKNIQEMVEIHFYGDGECRYELEDKASILLTENTYQFHGMVTDREEVYSNIDCMVVASETEGLSLAIIEAMSFEIPVIATNVGGNPRPVVNDKTGYLYEYDDAETLALLIKKYAENRELLSKHGYQAREHVGKKFSIENTVDTYEKVYAH